MSQINTLIILILLGITEVGFSASSSAAGNKSAKIIYRDLNGDRLPDAMAILSKDLKDYRYDLKHTGTADPWITERNEFRVERKSFDGKRYRRISLVKRSKFGKLKLAFGWDEKHKKFHLTNSKFEKAGVLFNFGDTRYCESPKSDDFSKLIPEISDLNISKDKFLNLVDPSCTNGVGKNYTRDILDVFADFSRTDTEGDPKSFSSCLIEKNVPFGFEFQVVASDWVSREIVEAPEVRCVNAGVRAQCENGIITIPIPDQLPPGSKEAKMQIAEDLRHEFLHCKLNLGGSKKEENEIQRAVCKCGERNPSAICDKESAGLEDVGVVPYTFIDIDPTGSVEAASFEEDMVKITQQNGGVNPIESVASSPGKFVLISTAREGDSNAEAVELARSATVAFDKVGPPLSEVAEGAKQLIAGAIIPSAEARTEAATDQDGRFSKRKTIRSSNNFPSSFRQESKENGPRGETNFAARDAFKENQQKKFRKGNGKDFAANIQESPSNGRQRSEQGANNQNLESQNLGGSGTKVSNKMPVSEIRETGRRPASAVPVVPMGKNVSSYSTGNRAVEQQLRHSKREGTTPKATAFRSEAGKSVITLLKNYDSAKEFLRGANAVEVLEQAGIHVDMNGKKMGVDAAKAKTKFIYRPDVPKATKIDEGWILPMLSGASGK